MFRGIEKKGFYTMERIWFSDKEKSSADVIRYNRIEEPFAGIFVHNMPAETVFSDITKSTEEILADSTKTVKYEVNKCAKEGILVEHFTSSDLGDGRKDIVDEFEEAYKDFSKDLGKDVQNAYQRSKIDNMIAEKYILISKASIENVAVYHVYAWGGSESCLLYSVSNFREDPSKRNLAGRMNKLLHIRDIDWLRDHNVTLYDWGNLSSSKNPNGIDKFKMSFGGEVVTVYNAFVGNSLIGKLLVIFYKITH